VKANANQITRALDLASEEVRFFLLHGPDDAGSRALMARLDRAMGNDAERIDLDGTTLSADPARLSDEAAAISLFGDRRWIRVTGGEDCFDAVEALLDAPVAGNPVVMIAGGLKPSSALLKLALAAGRAMSYASYRAEGDKASELVLALARPMGLRLAPRVAETLAASSGGDRSLMERELDKIALYLDAAPDRPRDATMETIDAIGADLGDTDTSALVDAVFDGDLAAVTGNWRDVASDGSSIPIMRAMTRRTLVLARFRAEVDSGRSPGAVMAASGKSLFFKDKDSIGRQLSRWNAQRLRTVATRLMRVEAELKQTGTAGDVLAGEEIVAIARVARRLR
jgi:DNA polymerase-3 subunit delta